MISYNNLLYLDLTEMIKHEWIKYKRVLLGLIYHLKTSQIKHKNKVLQVRKKKNYILNVKNTGCDWVSRQYLVMTGNSLLE